MDSVDTAYIEALKTLANSKAVVKLCEPNIISHDEITENHVVRLLVARKLLEDGLKG